MWDDFSHWGLHVVCLSLQSGHKSCLLHWYSGHMWDFIVLLGHPFPQLVSHVWFNGLILHDTSLRVYACGCLWVKAGSLHAMWWNLRSTQKKDLARSTCNWRLTLTCIRMIMIQIMHWLLQAPLTGCYHSLQRTIHSSSYTPAASCLLFFKTAQRRIISQYWFLCGSWEKVS